MKDTIEKVLDNVRREVGYFPKGIEVVENPAEDTISIDLEKFNIVYNKDFVQKMINYLEDLLRHEVGHFAWVPRNSEKYVFLDFILYTYGRKNGDNRLLNPKLRNFIINLFADVKVNSRILYNYRNFTNLDKIYKKIKVKEDIMKVHVALQSEISKKLGLNKDFGIYKRNLPENLKIKIDQLIRINWLDIDKYGIVNYIPDYKDLEKQIINYYRILQDILPTNIKEKGLIDTFGVPKKDVPTIMRRILEKNPNISPNDARDYLNDYYKRNKNRSKNKSWGAAGNSPLIKASIDVYFALISRYEIKMEPIFMKCGGSVEISGFDKWTLDKEIEKIYIIGPTGPLLLPEITPTIEYNEGLEETSTISIPDLLIVLDISGSMTNPIRDVSKAVVSAGVVARNYIERGREVGIVLFSDYTKFLGYSKNLEDVLNKILLYQGGGTVLDLNIVEDAIKKAKYKLDVIVISDFYIHEVIIGRNSFFSEQAIDKIIEILNSERKVERGYLFFVNENLQQKEEEHGKVGVYTIKNWDDIRGIVIRNL